MMKFEVVENVEMNEENGGWIVVKVVEDKVGCDKVVEFVELSFDFGESLCSIDIEGRDDDIEDVFSEECCDEIRCVDFMIDDSVEGGVV